jgi:hypothetical protein
VHHPPHSAADAAPPCSPRQTFPEKCPCPKTEKIKCPKQQGTISDRNNAKFEEGFTYVLDARTYKVAKAGLPVLSGNKDELCIIVSPCADGPPLRRTAPPPPPRRHD